MFIAARATRSAKLRRSGMDWLSLGHGRRSGAGIPIHAAPYGAWAGVANVNYLRSTVRAGNLGGEAVTCFPLGTYAQIEGSSVFSAEPPMPLGQPLRSKVRIFKIMWGKASPAARARLHSLAVTSPEPPRSTSYRR